jgi:hypothetical protein
VRTSSTLRLSSSIPINFNPFPVSVVSRESLPPSSPRATDTDVREDRYGRLTSTYETPRPVWKVEVEREEVQAALKRGEIKGTLGKI